jgi:hypothetical protein
MYSRYLRQIAILLRPSSALKSKVIHFRRFIFQVQRRLVENEDAPSKRREAITMLRSVTTPKTIARWTLIYRTGEKVVAVRLLKV